jgi:uncharacterized protein (TIGR03437 family)
MPGSSSKITLLLIICAICAPAQVKPMATVPLNASRPPVVLLNGWVTGYVNSCPVSTDSSAAFGNLARYLIADGVPAVYFFDNCKADPNQPIEVLANDLGAFLKSITYDDGTPVTQIDLVAHSIGGLIARAYLAGLQTDGSLAPPANTLVRKLVLIGTPNFGSFVAGNFASIISPGTQSAELIPGSSFLWNLATWNQHVDDLRGVDAIAVIGNAGTYTNSLTGTTLANASDGVVSLTSASLNFVAQNSNVTRVVPYCQVDPSAFTNISLQPYNCNAPGIANVTTEAHFTGQIVRSFLAGTNAWSSIGTTPATDVYLTTNGGTFFALVNGKGGYVSDISQVLWGSLTLQSGADSGKIFYNDFVSGTGNFKVTSSSAGNIDCGQVTEAVGYFAAARCKIATAIISVGPLASTSPRVVNSGANIKISGATFGFQCNGCKVVATPAGGNGQELSVSSWTGQAITANLPASLSGLVTISVLANTGNDSINVMVASPAPPAGATITGITNAGSFQTGIAPATWVSIFGSNLSPKVYLWQASDFVNGQLPTTLQGVSVTINGKPAYVEYVSPAQINVLAPDDTATGAVSVQVTASNVATAQLQQFAPAFFANSGIVAAQHADYSLVSTANPAKPGEVIQLYGTGFGPTSPAVPTGQLAATSASLANQVQISVGGADCSIQFAGLVGAGLYQFNVVVPAVGNGNAAVAATIGGLQTQAGVSVPVQQ